MKILVVEDELLVRELVVDELRDAGFEVLEAETGAEAIERCRENDPDVLFTDIRLPGNLDGWQIAERCREAKPSLPVIYATGYSDQTRMVPGAVLFKKPYRAVQIVAAIEQLTRAA
jgi:CheY-like chemotaxis protein